MLSRPRLTARLTGLVAAALLALPLASVVSLAAAPAADAAVPSLRAPAGLPLAIEPLASYVEQTECHPGYLPGTLKLGQLLTSTYRNTSFGGAYACGTDGTRSEHYDGRAVDWMNSVRNKTQAAQAAAVIKFLLTTDSHHNMFANARRMGVMYIIWDNKIWGAWDGKWENYNNCAKTPAASMDSACHRNHMHISLSWNGALGRTSFWSKHTVSTVNYGQCRVKDLNWAGTSSSYSTKWCASYPAVNAPAHSSAAMKALVNYSGATMFPGMTGGPIQAVQMAFKMPVTGRYDPATVARVNALKRKYHLLANGVIDAATWRLLLAANKPH
ncbi:MAG: peptidoglycan-binding protein [Actinomycetota bacterium]|nr:peptidoglycan-binding protein [Actinomycetota bacterium]MDQ2956225.1 peptidoglycan-binding protein [Actinomycetota bacterium]